MEKKTLTAVVILTTLLCGLPGICGLCFGSMAVLGSFLPDTGVPPEDTALAVGISIMILGLSLIGIAIPVGLGIWSWQSQRSKALSLGEVLIPEDDF